MTTKLTYTQVQALIDQVLQEFPHEDCNTCECFLGYLAKLTADSDLKDTDPDGVTLRSLLASYKPDRAALHKCLGCDPCPPADVYAAYLRRAG